MSVALAVALLALLVASFAVVALVAVYARVRTLEAGDAAGLSGYATLVGRPAPAAVRPGPRQRAALVAVVDGACALCRPVLASLAAVAAMPEVRVVALTDRLPADADHRLPAGALRVDPAARADLFEGYAPTVLAVDAAGTVVARRFVYTDTDLSAVLRELGRQAGVDVADHLPAAGTTEYAR
jgi:hypothetical protein